MCGSFLEKLEKVPVPATQSEEPALHHQEHLKPWAISKAHTSHRWDSPAGTTIPVCLGFPPVDVSETLFGETVHQHLWWEQPFGEWFCDCSCGAPELPPIAYPGSKVLPEPGSEMRVSGHFRAFRCLASLLCWRCYVWAPTVFPKVSGAMNVNMVQETQTARLFGLNSSAASGSWRRNFSRRGGKVHVLLIPAAFVDMLWIRMGWDSDPLAGWKKIN